MKVDGFTDVSFLKVSELKKTPSGAEKKSTSTESTPESELKPEVPPSSSAELLGFTSASEIYSVGIYHIRVF